MTGIELINSTAEIVDNKHLDFYKVLIPKMSDSSLKDQIRRFTDDYYRYKSLNQLTILIELRKEEVKRQEIELKILENTNT